jgi:Na+/H+ antiporter NhaD/arsenite permease-like protein
MMIRAVTIFAVTYALISTRRAPFIRVDRPTAALAGAVFMVAAGVLTPADAYRAVDWDTIALLLGMFLLTGSLRLAGFFDLAATALLRRARTPGVLLIAITSIAGLLSALLVNDTVCVMFAPFVIMLVARSGIPIAPHLFGLAVGANVGSVMTVVGNPQNMVIAGAAPLPYASFARVMVPAGVVALAVALVVLWTIFRRELGARGVPDAGPSSSHVDRPLLVKTIVCFVLTSAGFMLGFQLAWTALAGALVLLLISGRSPRQILAEVDGALLLFFAALFVVVAGLERSGVLAEASAWVAPSLGEGGVVGLLKFSLVSVLASNLVSNVPWVVLAATWLPHGAGHQREWLVLALTAAFAGNLTLLGSVANIIVFETARDRCAIGFWRFLAIGAPITVLTTAVGLAVVWALT